ncbi:MAG: DUF928 domain-containing protein [Elainellaceae cyanobacterium]
MLIKPFSQLVSFSLLGSLIPILQTQIIHECCAGSSRTTPTEPIALLYQTLSISSKASISFQAKDSHWGERHTGSQTSGDPRDECPQVDVPLTALMPDTHWGKSTSQTPTFWFYVPYTSQQIDRGEFVLQDAEGFDVIEPIQFALPATPGFVRLTLPESVPVLEAGVDYSWAFQLYCDRESRTPIFVEGWIQREIPTDEISNQLEAGLIPTYQVYWENGIWFDAVDALMQAWQEHPTNGVLETEWIRLLQEGGLDTEALPADPILGTVILSD